MIIGLISDTHDNLPYIEKAVERLNEEKVELVLHAGDYISLFTAKPFMKLDAPMIGVYGNNCAETDTLKRAYAEAGCEIRGYFTEVKADNLKIALLHGHRWEDLKRADRGRYDVVVRGHTHRASIREKGDQLWLNPSEVCGYITGTNSIGFLDTEKRHAWISILK